MLYAIVIITSSPEIELLQDSDGDSGGENGSDITQHGGMTHIRSGRHPLEDGIQHYVKEDRGLVSFHRTVSVESIMEDGYASAEPAKSLLSTPGLGLPS